MQMEPTLGGRENVTPEAPLSRNKINWLGLPPNAGHLPLETRSGPSLAAYRASAPLCHLRLGKQGAKVSQLMCAVRRRPLARAHWQANINFQPPPGQARATKSGPLGCQSGRRSMQS